MTSASTVETAAPARSTHDQSPAAESLLGEVVRGLGNTPKTLPCKLFYDDAGSHLFDAICCQPEYYPTRTELSIMEAAAKDMARACGSDCRIVEFGCGSGEKTRLLARALTSPTELVLIDISQEAVSGAADRLAATLGGNIPVTPVTADYTSEVDLPNGQRAPRRTVVYFPGSTIGNFEWPDAVDFIRRCRALVGPGGAVLIGTDLTKDADTLEAAYNDRAGVTGAFNKNLLNHCNHRLGTSFDLADFEHRAIYDAEERRIEMHLVAQRDLTMTVAGQRFPMEEGSHIRTEFSHKYRMEDIDRLAESGGFRRTRTWTDPKKWFAVSLFEGD